VKRERKGGERERGESEKREERRERGKKERRGKKRRCDVVPQGKMRSPNEEERRLSIHIV